MPKNGGTILKNKTLTVIASFIMAICIWGYVVYNENPISTLSLGSIPVRVVNESALAQQGLSLASFDDYYVSVKLQGTKKNLANIDMGQITATVDLAGYGEGVSQVPVTITRMNEGLTVADIRPATIELTIEKTVSGEKEVKIAYRGELSDGFIVGDTQLDPGKVTVTGAQSLVDEVTNVRGFVDVTGLSSDIRGIVVKLAPVDPQGEIVEHVSVSPDTVKVSTDISYRKDVRLVCATRGTPADGGTVTLVSGPDTVTLTGEHSILEGMDTVTGFVDVSGLTESGRVQIALELPAGVSQEALVYATVELGKSGGDGGNEPEPPEPPEDEPPAVEEQQDQTDTR